MFQINGHEISGFTPETFPQALARAAAEGLRAERSSIAGKVDVISGKAIYQATAQTCTCTAGRFHKPCKHRALVAYLTEGLGVDLTQAVRGFRVRPEAVAVVAAAIEREQVAPVAAPVTEPAAPKLTLAEQVRAGWTVALPPQQVALDW
jgi:hypothetical protein